MAIYYSILITLLLGCLNLAADDFWSEPIGPFGGDIKEIKKDSKGNLYSITDGNFFKSSDNGNNWERIPFSNTLDKFLLCMDIDQHDNIFLGSWRNLLYSTNQGTSWIQFDRNLKDRAVLSMHITSMGDYLFGTDRGLYRFKWDNEPVFVELILNYVQIISLAADERDSIIFGGTASEGLYIGYSWGKLWDNKKVSENPFMRINSITLMGGDSIIVGLEGLYPESGGILLTTDYANKWTSWSINTYNTYVTLFADSRLYAGTEQGIFYYDYKNGYWTKYGDNQFSAKVNNILPAFNAIYIATGNGIYKKMNSEQEWEQANDGLNSISLNDIFLHKNKYLFAQNYRYNITDNTWSRLAITNNESLSIIESIVTDDEKLLSVTHNGLYVSSDFGKTWERNTNGIIDKDFKCIRKGKKGHVFIGTNPQTINRIYFSADNGTSWTGIGRSDRQAGAVSIAEDSTGNVLYMAVGEDGLYRKDSNDTTWIKLLSIENYLPVQIECGTDNNIYCLANGRINISSDKGASWDSVSLNEIVSPRSITISHDGSLYIGNSNGDFFCRGFNSNSTLKLSGNKNFLNIRDIQVSDNGFIYIGTSHGLFKSENPLSIKTSAPPGVNHFQFFPNPSSGFIKFEYGAEGCGHITLSIYNQIGRRIYTGGFAGAAGMFSGEVDLSANSGGVYFYRAEDSDGKSYSGSFIIIR